jgi:hypothetical protein
MVENLSCGIHTVPVQATDRSDSTAGSSSTDIGILFQQNNTASAPCGCQSSRYAGDSSTRDQDIRTIPT